MDSFLWVPVYENYKPDFDSCLTCATSASRNAQLSSLAWGSPRLRHQPPAALGRRFWSPFPVGGAGLRTGPRKGSSTHAPDLCPSPRRAFWEPRCDCRLQWARVSHIIMMRRVQCSKAALAAVPRLQKQTKALVIPWLAEEISQCKMAFLSPWLRKPLSKNFFNNFFEVPFLKTRAFCNSDVLFISSALQYKDHQCFKLAHFMFMKAFYI